MVPATLLAAEQQNFISYIEGTPNYIFGISIIMDDDKVFQQASLAIVDAKKLISEAEAALLRAAQFEREHGLSKEAIDNFLNSRLSSKERQELESHVQEKLKEIHEEAEQAIADQKMARARVRSNKIKLHV